MRTSGLRAGQTIAATYPAAVIGMAVLRIFKGSILEENIARTAGSIGESVAAGAIFTIPAFVISRSWLDFSPGTAYWKSTSLMLVGSVLGVLFVSLVRRGWWKIRICRSRNPLRHRRFIKPDKWARKRRNTSSTTWHSDRRVFLAGAFNFFATDKDWLFPVGQIGEKFLASGPAGNNRTLCRPAALRCFPDPRSAPLTSAWDM